MLSCGGVEAGLLQLHLPSDRLNGCFSSAARNEVWCKRSGAEGQTEMLE